MMISHGSDEDDLDDDEGAVDILERILVMKTSLPLLVFLSFSPI